MLGGLPRRDLWLLPLTALATLTMLLAGSEVAARVIWPEQIINHCMMVDPELGIHYRPNCSAVMKTAEGPWVLSHYNDCGYRSTASCREYRLGTRRVALLGTSISEGYLVEYPNTIAARLESDLTSACHTSVQVQNLGSLGYFGRWMLPRMNDALALKPAAILLILTPFDLEMITDEPPATAGTKPPNINLQRTFVQAVKESRVVTMAQHFMFRDPSVYLPLYLQYGDKADFLRSPFSPRWQVRLAILQSYISRMAESSHTAGVPFAIAFVPHEAEIGFMTRDQPLPNGVYPMALPNAIEAMAKRYDVGFIDTSVALRKEKAPEKLYYQVDGHLSGQGQPIAAAYIAQQFTEKMHPFDQCKARQTATLDPAS
jgi:hypothetical protein